MTLSCGQDIKYISQASDEDDTIGILIRESNGHLVSSKYFQILVEVVNHGMKH